MSYGNLINEFIKQLILNYDLIRICIIRVHGFKLILTTTLVILYIKYRL